MKKLSVPLPLFLFLSLILTPPSSAGFLETITFEEPSRIFIFKGPFSKPVIAMPQELVFSYEIQTPGSQSHERYYFVTRSSEKSFDLRHTYGTFMGMKGGRPPEEKITILFREGSETYPLPMGMLTLPGCPVDVRAHLVVLELKENWLSYQIILPQCLKEVLFKK
jgi:hypothetical protein